MLPKSHHVEQVYYKGDNNIISCLSPTNEQQGKKLFIECSTIDPAVTREVGAKVQEAGPAFADAAVSVRILQYIIPIEV
jgi:3-hydroxyisobutyrate dehydrogenase-like beta-hydroxyacid dehydrogenase